MKPRNITDTEARRKCKQRHLRFMPNIASVVCCQYSLSCLLPSIASVVCCHSSPCGLLPVKMYKKYLLQKVSSLLRINFYIHRLLYNRLDKFSKNCKPSSEIARADVIVRETPVGGKQLV